MPRPLLGPPPPARPWAGPSSGTPSWLSPSFLDALGGLTCSSEAGPQPGLPPGALDSRLEGSGPCSCQLPARLLLPSRISAKATRAQTFAFSLLTRLPSFALSIPRAPRR